MARSNPPSERILLVEGQNDLHMVLHLCNNHPEFSVKGTLGSEQVILEPPPHTYFTVEDKKGVSELLKSIRTEVRVSGRQALGILADADEDLPGRWDELSKQFQQAGITLPDHPHPEGTLVDIAGSPRVGVWLMPNNESVGELEDFVKEMIPTDDPVWPLSQNYIDGIPERDRRFRPAKATKAQVHAWLSARKNPRQIGAAIGDGDLQTDTTLCQTFTSWLIKLFG